MFSTIFAIRTSDPDTHFRGMLLKGIALVLGIGSLLDSFLIFSQDHTISAPIIGAFTAFIIICITFGLAHTGFVSHGSILLASTLFLIIGRVVPPDSLLNSPMAMAFLFPLLIIGLTINAMAAAGFAGTMVTILTFGIILNYIPNNNGSTLSLLLLTISSVFIWLIMFTLERGRNQARQQNKNLEAAQKVILAREDDLQHSNDQMKKKNDDLEHMLELVNQLETPIIPLTDESLIVPLVGHLDTRRIEHIRETVLETVYQTHVHYVLIDLTGIAVIDTGVIGRLNHMIKCIHLLGTEVLLTGIRAETAITMTTLGVDFAEVWTSANLSDGVRHVLRQLSV